MHRAIYELIITPLLKAWNHPTVLQPIKDAMVVFKPDVSLPLSRASLTYILFL